MPFTLHYTLDCIKAPFLISTIQIYRILRLSINILLNVLKLHKCTLKIWF